MKKTIISALLATVVLGSAASITEAAQVGDSAVSQGSVDFKVGGQDPKPFDPSDPTVPPAEVTEGGSTTGKGTSGLLRFDRVPNFKFETIEIGSKDQLGNVLQEEYTDKASGNKFHAAPTVEITDVRGVGTGWSAFVKADGVLKGSNDITGYQLTFNKAVVSSYSGVTAAPTAFSTPFVLNDQPQRFVSAADGTGTASWGISFFDETEAGAVKDGKPAKNTTGKALASDAVTLSVPQGAVMKTGETYTTSLTWYLNDDPSATSM